MVGASQALQPEMWVEGNPSNTGSPLVLSELQEIHARGIPSRLCPHRQIPVTYCADKARLMSYNLPSEADCAPLWRRAVCLTCQARVGRGTSDVWRAVG
jgi:hypothetical protein